jgi:hypothetical protein
LRTLMGRWDVSLTTVPSHGTRPRVTWTQSCLAMATSTGTNKQHRPLHVPRVVSMLACLYHRVGVGSQIAGPFPSIFSHVCHFTSLTPPPKTQSDDDTKDGAKALNVYKSGSEIDALHKQICINCCWIRDSRFRTRLAAAGPS